MVLAQSTPYTSYLTGDSSDVETNPTSGLCLMGGATENDSAMKWFLQRADGGDVVVIRTSGANGYNDYMFNQLGVTVNSVETLIIPNATACSHPYVLNRIHNAEALWIAGGDQYTYVSLWKDKPIEAEINYLINAKNVPVGGTSAGMAILGAAYFDAANGTVSSASALTDPYNSAVSIGFDDFIHHPYMYNVITDTHYDNPDRRGRHVAFLARLAKDFGIRSLGIACEEYTAVCVDENGLGRVFGEYPQENDYAYFVETNCFPPFVPETCVAGSPLTWVRNQKAVRVYKVAGTPTGDNTFSLVDFRTGTGGTWYNWYVTNGMLNEAVSVNIPECDLVTIEGNTSLAVDIQPNPAHDRLSVSLPQAPTTLKIWDMQGKLCKAELISENQTTLSTIDWPEGIYHVYIQSAQGIYTQKVVIQHSF